MSYQFVREPLNSEECDRIVNACRSFQEKLVVWVLLDTGLRVGEFCNLRKEQIHWQENRLVVWGKGGKERRVGFSARLAAELEAYLTKRTRGLAQIGEERCPWVFPNDRGGCLTSKAVQQRIARYAAAAGIGSVRVTPHVLRHTFAVQFVRAGGSVFHLQRILGHSSLEMSRRYCELAETDWLTRHQELSPLATMDLKLPGPRRLPRSHDQTTAGRRSS